MGEHEFLLLRRAKTDEQRVRGGVVHGGDRRIVGLKVAVVRSADDQTGREDLHFFRGSLGNAGLGAKQIQPRTAPGKNRKQLRGKVDPCDLRPERGAEDLCRQNHARSVRQKEIGLIEQIAEIGVLGRLIGNFSVRRDHDAGAVPIEQAFARGKRFLHRYVIKLKTKHVELHIRSRLSVLYHFIIIYHTFPDLSRKSRLL